MERRTAERKTFALPVEYDLGAAAGESGSVIHIAQGQNICEYGLRISTDYPLKKGAVLRLSADFTKASAGFGGKVLPVFAEVAWAMPVGSSYSAGLRFLR